MESQQLDFDLIPNYHDKDFIPITISDLNGCSIIIIVIFKKNTDQIIKVSVGKYSQIDSILQLFKEKYSTEYDYYIIVKAISFFKFKFKKEADDNILFNNTKREIVNKQQLELMKRTNVSLTVIPYISDSIDNQVHLKMKNGILEYSDINNKHIKMVNKGG